MDNKFQISLPYSLVLKKEGRHNKKAVSQLRLQECWPLFIEHLLSGLLPVQSSIESSYRFEFEI
jgi:hypothetical protein